MLSIKNRQKGFTLVELLVVIAIIGILVTVTLVALNPFGQINKARDSQRKSDLKQIQTALELYYQDNDAYPNAVSFGSPWTPYMQKVPQDKSGSYAYVKDGIGYRLFASLDNKTDPQACTQDGSACATVPSGTNCGTGRACNYEVKSSNL